MISVDIYVPFLDRTYDFALDDSISVSEAVGEAVEMICQRERWPVPEEPCGLTLSSPQLGRIMDGGETLRGAGIQTGTRLILC